VNILFTALHFANYRNFESVIRDLAARGHHVHLLADEKETFGGEALVERLVAEYPTITWGWTPSPAGEPWFPFAQKVRFALDYVRFLDPRYAEAEKLRIRNIERTPRIVRWMTSGLGGTLVGHRATASLLKRIERLLPRSRGITQLFEEQRPDVVLLTSLTFSRSFAMDQVKAARALGIPTAACIMSWDHLSSKALVHIQPDTTILWNDVQKHEAVDMHGIPAASVVVTGAQCYDQWFDKRPTRSREAFCRDVGLDPSHPFVLYVCSAMSPVPDPVEPVFVKEWIDAVRSSSDPVLREAGVLVRPHPERMREWKDVSFAGLDNVAVHGRNPIDADAKADYFDSLYYSSAVVGLCTTVFLEAAIIGRPVLTLQLPAYRLHQDGMLHFRYLLTVEGGLLHTAPDIPSHVSQLGAAVRGEGVRDERNRRFITAFVRPKGLATPATPPFVDAVEQLARSGRRAPDQRLIQPSPWRGVVRRLALDTRSGPGAWLLMDTLDELRSTSEQGRAQLKRAVLEERSARWEAERVEREQRAALDRVERRTKQRLRAWKLRKQQWKRWRYTIVTSRPVVRLKDGLRMVLGARQS
jgi:hypothetical protein